jgi:aminoglycoside phosphotransferase
MILACVTLLIVSSSLLKKFVSGFSVLILKSLSMKTLILFFAGIIIIFPAKAQEKNVENIYWVLEKNLNDPKVCLLKFYNENEVLHEQIIQGRRMDIRKPRHKRMLDQLLQKYKEGKPSTVKKSKIKTSKLI